MNQVDIIKELAQIKGFTYEDVGLDGKDEIINSDPNPQKCIYYQTNNNGAITGIKVNYVDFRNEGDDIFFN